MRSIEKIYYFFRRKKRNIDMYRERGIFFGKTIISILCLIEEKIVYIYIFFLNL